MDSPIRHLEAQGVMLGVFNQLESLDDLLVCSSVSKSWNTLIREARPNSLKIGATDYSPRLDAEGAVCTLRWLQAKQRAGHLQNLKEFWLLSKESFRDQYEQPRLQSAFVEAVVMCTGLWNLKSCTLEGFFCLEQAVAVLPTTLKQLELTPAQPPPQFHLSVLSRFANLQLLALAGTEEGLPPSYIHLSEYSMPAVRSLKAHKPFQIVGPYDEQLQALEVEVAIALPCLVQLTVSIPASSGGVALANTFINLKGLKELDMCLVGPPTRPIVLKLMRSSSLALLRLEADDDVQPSLEIRKRSLEYELYGVTTVLMPRPFRGLSKLHVI